MEQRSDGVSPWWKRAVFYQIYPRSFVDSNGDGVGDLNGIRARLDYVQWLGVDAVWISPVFPSPMADFGYDISDYCGIDPVFGSLADMDALIADCHARNLKVMLDWVPNHSSNQHPWFLESRSSRTNPKADWYVWRDEPANNWIAEFSATEPVWTFDDQRQQWYLHLFLPEQPDLNWDNPDVEVAMHDTLRFWLDRGVDGFRMDVIHTIGKDVDEDDPDDHVAAGRGHVRLNDVPVTHERLRAIRGVLDSYDGDRTAVGEVYLLDEARMAEYYGDSDELHMSFNFAFLWQPWDAARLRRRITTTLSHLDPRGAWPTWAFSNHDVTRHRQRHGGSEQVARVAAVMLLTLPGTPFVYQGEELGLLDAEVPADRVVDPGGRDGCRAPIPWTAAEGHGWGPNAWLPFAPEVDVRNVATLQADPDSILHLYRNMLQLRRDHTVLQTGRFAMIDRRDDVIVYTRSDHERTYVIALNLGASAGIVDELAGTRLLLSTNPREEFSGADQVLAANTGVVAVRA
jgi:alpha-glucosidase